MRAGWRLSIFIAILSLLLAGATAVGHGLEHGRRWEARMSAESIIFGEAALFVLVLSASWIMAMIEGRKIADYGLPSQRAFCGQFWQGIVIGFASITALLAALRVAGVFHFGMMVLHGAQLWKYAFLWCLAFLFVGFFEEFFFRGYVLFTLTTGVGFWPAAIILSTLFGCVHHGNPGETWVGAFSAGAVGFLFCLVLRRTGDLWMAIGFHAAWDWGQTYFYGVADSGQVAPGHLFESSFSGPVWLTGGSVGPEGSWLCILEVVLLWLIFAAWWREGKYPNPAAIPDPRRTAFASTLPPRILS
jgi:hypothetical protein